MSSSDIAISVRGLGKSYTIRHNAAPITTFAEAIMHRLRHPFGRRAEQEVFWALKDVSFEVKRGEVIGIIGRNGAGKSTLLKILSRITEMTEGEVDLYGRVGSLLEVGTGFHQELTGRENIFLNGAILGMTRAEIRKHFDAIVDFAGVEKFLDTPVKRYSSGMYVRLAFAVAAHLRSEILIVDEVLAVGDAEFQKKCLGKMKEVSAGGRTVLFVSHNLAAVTQLCDAAVVLSAGEVAHDGEVAAGVEAYRSCVSAQTSANSGLTPAGLRRQGSGEYRFLSVLPRSSVFGASEDKRFDFVAEHQFGTVPKVLVVGLIIAEDGTVVARCDSRALGKYCEGGNSVRGHFALRTPWLKPGEYRVDMLLGADGLVDVLENACRFSVGPQLPYPVANPQTLERTVVLADFECEFELAEPTTTEAETSRRQT